jgi:hypothetical protein
MLVMLGFSSALQFVIEGIAIALGMALSRINFSQLATLVTNARSQSREEP